MRAAKADLAKGGWQVYWQKYNNFLKLLLRNRKLLEEAVTDARAEQLKNKGDDQVRDKYQQSNPTAQLAIKKASRIRKVCFLLPRGGYLTLYKPEQWLDVINNVYGAYDAKHIGVLLHEHFDDGRSLDLLAGFHGISRQSAFDLRRDFLADAAFMAAMQGLLGKNPEK